MSDRLQKKSPQIRIIQRVVLILTLFTGFAGLVYEVTWHRYLANLMGSEARASALILAVFLGGLSGGYFIFGHFSQGRSNRSLLRILGWSEIGIGVWAVLFPFFYRGFWNLLGVLPGGGFFSLFLDVLVSVFFIGLPTVLMGGTLPLLTQSLSGSVEEAPKFHARVYANNTAGAFLGSLSAGFFLLPSFGLRSTLWIMAAVNVVCGAAVLALAQRVREDFSASKKPTEKKISMIMTGWQPFAKNIAIAFLAGFSSIALQAVFIRLIGKTIGSTEFAFCMVVGVYIFMLAVGSWTLRHSEKPKPLRVAVNQTVLFFGILLVYASVEKWPYLFHHVRIVFSSLKSSFYVYYAAVFLVLGVILSIPVAAMGRTLPLLFSQTARIFQGRSESLGRQVGWLYGSNTFGCVLGAILGGYLFLYFFNLEGVIKLALFLVGVTVFLSLPTESLARFQKTFLGFFLLGALSIFFLPAWDAKILGIGSFRRQTPTPTSFSGAARFYSQNHQGLDVLAYKDGPNTSVTVVEAKPTGPKPTGPKPTALNRVLYVNGKPDGGTMGRDLVTTRLLAHLPALLQTADSKKAGVVGYGTGITPGSLTLYPNLHKIDVIEIASTVKDVAHFFDFANHAASTHPKVSWHIEDAYRVLGATKEKYAVLVSEPSNPWIAGVERLYSQEFYRLVLESLAEGGIYSQWFHLYAMSPQTVDMVIATFSSVFPHVHFFRIRGGGDLILLGAKSALDFSHLKNLEERLVLPEIKKELEEISLDAPENIFSQELWLSPQSFFSALNEENLHTLEFPKLAHQAGRDFFLGQQVELADYHDRLPHRLRVRQAANQSLSAKWLSTKPSLPGIKHFVAGLCGQEDLSTLMGRSLPCRQAIVALHLQGVLPKPHGLSEKEKNWLQLLKTHSQDQTRQSKQTFTLSQAEEALHVFLNHDSILMALSSERLKEILSPCFNVKKEGHACRSQWIQVLAMTDRKKEAQEGFGELMRDAKNELPPEVIRHFEVLIGQGVGKNPPAL